MTAVIVCESIYRCPSTPVAPAPQPADHSSFAEGIELVLTLGLFWLASALHVWSAMCVGSAIANGTFGSVDSLVALFVTVMLPVLAHKGFSVWEGIGPSRGEVRDAVSTP